MTITICYKLYFPRILDYTQKGTVEFYESIKEEDVYVSTWKFKSYAHYFYTDKKNIAEKIKEIPHEKRPYNLLRLNVDKPVYMVVKKNMSDEFEKKYNQFHKVHETFGYSFFYKPIEK